MEQVLNKTSFSIRTDRRAIILLIIVAILPNILGMVNISTIYGFKIHFFQYIIFVAAMCLGPIGAAISGGIGSLYSGIIFANPYLIIGNIILGFFTGYFYKKGHHVTLSVLLAFAIQLPWIFISDIYFMKMPLNVVTTIAVSLLVSNLLWALFAKVTYKRFFSNL